MAWRSFATSAAVAALALAGLGLIAWGAARQFGWPVSAMVVGATLMVAAVRAARELV